MWTRGLSGRFLVVIVVFAAGACISGSGLPGDGDDGDAWVEKNDDGGAGVDGRPGKDGSGLCAGVSCNGHGTCRVVAGKTRCDCEKGYESEGATCIAKDNDGDGAVGTNDCDDSDPQRAPGKTEKCDGVDNDCDMQVDENVSRSCGKAMGVCRQGQQSCTSGSWGACIGSMKPSNEKCDMKDNDCDGTTDEGVCSCSPGQSRPCGKDTGECTAGTQNCNAQGTGWGMCQGKVGPSSEKCNNKDDDCDGQTDEGDTCGIWRLKSGSNKWERFEMDPKNSTYAPKNAIRAAIDIEGQDKIFVLTNTTYRIFRPSALTWEPPKALTNLVPNIAGKDVTDGFGNPASNLNRKTGHDNFVVVAMDGSTAKYWIGEYKPSSGSVDWNTKEKTLMARTGSKAPPSISVETAAWLDLKNKRGWAQASPKQVCGAQKNVTATKIETYMGFLAENKFYVYDAGYCQEFTENYPHAQAPPAKITGAPSSFKKIGAASYHQGDLYFFRGD